MDLPAVTPPDTEALRAAVARHADLDVPDGALGRLAELGCWLAAAQGVCPPRPPGRPRVLILAADHGIAAHGVSAHPVGDTARRFATARDNASPVAVLAPAAGASVRMVDVGIDHGDSPPEDDRYRVRGGSGAIDREDALTPEETVRAVEIGRRIADEEADSGADLLVPAGLGVGATTPASVLVAALVKAEPVAVVGRGSGIDDAAWMRKAAAIRDGLRRARPHSRDPIALLGAVGGADLAALAGVCAQAAIRRTPVLLDGVVAGSAALVAEALAPGARQWWRVAQRSPEPAMELAAAHLHLEPLLDLQVRTTDGTGAVAVLPLLQMAARLLAETAGRSVAAP